LDEDEPIYFVSDGGLRDEKGSFGTILTTNNHTIATVQGRTPYSPEMDTSFRTESYGILSGLLLLEGVILTSKAESRQYRKIKMYCDNKSLVDVLNKHRKQQLTMKDYYKADVDVEIQILLQIAIFEALGISISITHVKGHQDKHVPSHKLPRPAQLNIIADEMATKALDEPAPYTTQSFRRRRPT
jgi:hypothetical protein